MSELTFGALLALILTGVVNYLIDSAKKRRAAAAEALIDAIKESQGERFLRDLEDPSHRGLIYRPLQSWYDAVRAAEGSSGDGVDLAEKFDEILGWRMREREARIRFAVTGRRRDVALLAWYFEHLVDLAYREGHKHVAIVDHAWAATVAALVETVIAIRVPTLLQPLHAGLRRTAGFRRFVIQPEDVRMLLGDVKERRPSTILTRGLVGTHTGRDVEAFPRID